MSENRGFHTEIDFTIVTLKGARWLETATFAHSFASAFASLLQWYIMAAFTSSITISDAQIATAPSLEPAFEHLLRNSTVHESVISVLRVNEVVDRDTFGDGMIQESS